MEDLKNKIPDIASQFTPITQEWITKRLNQEVDKNKKLPDEDTIRNIRDCLASLDEKSPVIQKLSKIALKDMNIIQDKWHKILAKKAEKLKAFGGKPFEYEPVVKCDNGFQWVRLDTPEAKDYEGNAMGHCVGSGAYDDNENLIFSLRDKDNIPHITVELDEREKKFKQVKGKGNTIPNEKYYYNIIKLHEETGATNYYELTGDQSYAVLDGKVLFGDKAILSCPPGTVFDSVNLGEDSKITEWNYSVSGDFNAGYSKLKYVDPDCKFGGKVNIRGTRIKEWHCDVAGNFDASFSKLEYVAPKCIFGGDVDILFSKIKEWHCDVPGYFNAENSKLKYVHPDCKFGNGINIIGTNIKEWHCDVPDDFDAYGSKLEYVNPDCVFGGRVDVSRTNIKEWHNDVPRYFNASNSKLEYVAPKCKFGGGVSIGETNIKEWHHDVPGAFFAGYSNIEYVNPDCKFGGYVDIRYTMNLKEWHNDVPGNFDAKGSKLEKIINCKIEGKIHCDDNVEIINEEKQVMRM